MIAAGLKLASRPFIQEQAAKELHESTIDDREIMYGELVHDWISDGNNGSNPRKVIFSASRLICEAAGECLQAQCTAIQADVKLFEQIQSMQVIWGYTVPIPIMKYVRKSMHYYLFWKYSHSRPFLTMMIQGVTDLAVHSIEEDPHGQTAFAVAPLVEAMTAFVFDLKKLVMLQTPVQDLAQIQKFPGLVDPNFLNDLLLEAQRCLDELVCHFESCFDSTIRIGERCKQLLRILDLK